MHDCNRHRPNGFRDKTWDDNIKHQSIEAFSTQRSIDQDRSQNLTNHRFPQLAEARDLYLK